MSPRKPKRAKRLGSIAFHVDFESENQTNRICTLRPEDIKFWSISLKLFSRFRNLCTSIVSSSCSATWYRDTSQAKLSWTSFCSSLSNLTIHSQTEGIHTSHFLQTQPGKLFFYLLLLIRLERQSHSDTSGCDVLISEIMLKRSTFSAPEGFPFVAIECLMKIPIHHSKSSTFLLRRFASSLA